jgi:hypothetical protein
VVITRINSISTLVTNSTIKIRLNEEFFYICLHRFYNSFLLKFLVYSPMVLALF